MKIDPSVMLPYRNWTRDRSPTGAPCRLLQIGDLSGTLLFFVLRHLCARRRAILGDEQRDQGDLDDFV